MNIIVRAIFYIIWFWVSFFDLTKLFFTVIALIATSLLWLGIPIALNNPFLYIPLTIVLFPLMYYLAHKIDNMP